jgi:molecular chaperone GrpE
MSDVDQTQTPAEEAPEAQPAPGPDRPHGDELEEAVEAAPEPQEEGSAEEVDPLAAAQAKADEMLALAQRTQADFENFRKRMARENAAAVDRGVGKLAKELLTPLDHLELALAAAEQQEGAADVVKGIRLVQDEFTNALNRAGIQPFSPKGEPFDPSEHEAMAQQPAPEGTEAGTVIEVYQQGYRLNGAVLRPARVVVAA